jgi:hypothetical protein
MTFPKKDFSKQSEDSKMLSSEANECEDMPVESSITRHLGGKSFPSGLSASDYQQEKGDFRFVADYVKNIQEQLSLLLKKMETKEEWDETSLIERSALLNQCVTTLKDNVSIFSMYI